MNHSIKLPVFLFITLFTPDFVCRCFIPSVLDVGECASVSE
jgi:hypothetical protein